MGSLYSLMNGEDELCSFKLVGRDFELTDIYTAQYNYMPYFLKCLLQTDREKDSLPIEFNKRFKAFLEHRTIGLNRIPNYVRMCQFFGLKDKFDYETILNNFRLVSLNDNYWIKRQDRPFYYKSINPYDHKLDPNLVKFTLASKLTPPTLKADPEQYVIDLSATGRQNKAWGEIDGYKYLFKTDELYNIHRYPEYICDQVYAEFFASQVAEFLKLNVVHYTLETIDPQDPTLIASKCRLINWKYYRLKSMQNVMVELILDNTDFYSDLENVLIRNNKKYKKALNFLGRKQFSDQALLDCLIYNTGRHLNNYSLTLHNLTLQNYGMSKIYDQGHGMFAGITLNQYETHREKLFRGAATTGPNINLTDRFLKFATEEHLNKLFDQTMISYFYHLIFWGCGFIYVSTISSRSGTHMCLAGSSWPMFVPEH